MYSTKQDRINISVRSIYSEHHQRCTPHAISMDRSDSTELLTITYFIKLFCYNKKRQLL